ncbi:hypothetical protein HG530_013326 [Fusarium avenaceum]|nr:hypothetical protein HG530_013326 [Fusarium avenaceum]
MFVIITQSFWTTKFHISRQHSDSPGILIQVVSPTFDSSLQLCFIIAQTGTLTFPYIINCLPLGLGAVDELLEDVHNLGEGSEVGLELSLDLLRVLTELGVKVLSVGNGGHGGAEDGLDHEVVMGLQGVGVGATERVGKLLGGVVDVLLKALGSEVKTTDELLADGLFIYRKPFVPDEPETALGGSVLLLLEFVSDEVLDGGRLSRSGGVTSTELL